MSEKLSELPIAAQLLYTWMIPHADDLGLLQGSAKTIKAQVVPMSDMSLSDIDGYLSVMCQTELLHKVVYSGKSYFYIMGFERFQQLRRDRQPQTILEIELKSDPKQNWEYCEQLISSLLKNTDFPDADNGISTIDSQMTDTDSQLTAEVNRSEEKRREIKLNTGDADARPEIFISKGGLPQPLSQVLSDKPSPKPSLGISTPWQEKALRYADALQIDLLKAYKPRWMKVFKQAHQGKNRGNLEQAYSYLADYEKPIDNEGKILLFFKIFENGLQVFEGGKL